MNETLNRLRWSRAVRVGPRTWSLAALGILTVAWLAAVPAATVSAHVLESDGDISAVLHMPPDDVPVAGRNAVLELAFAAADPAFDINDYRISIQVQRDGKNLETAALEPTAGSPRNGSVSVNLPDVGAYRLAVRGDRKDGGQTFELDYDIRAVRSAGGGMSGIAAAGADFWVLSLGSLVLLAVLAQRMISAGGRYAAPQKATAHRKN